MNQELSIIYLILGLPLAFIVRGLYRRWRYRRIMRHRRAPQFKPGRREVRILDYIHLNGRA